MALTDMLTDIANAIRSKTGKTATMTPSDMPGEILAIPSGGGGLELQDAILDGSATEIYTEAEAVVDYALYKQMALKIFVGQKARTLGHYGFRDCASLTTIDLPACTTIGDYSLRDCASLTTIDLPACTTIGSYSLYGCTSLTTLDLPVCTSIGATAFNGCTSLTTLDLPVCTSIGTSGLANCTSLTTLDLPVSTSISANAFNGCSSLATLILRSPTRATLSNVNALANTPIASGTGYIYVPAALVESYKTATNWVTYASQIRAIEDFPEVQND